MTVTPFPHPSDGNPQNTRSEQIALDLIRRGISPVPVPVGKKPNIPGWQNLRITAADVPRYFGRGNPNVGAIMGPASGGLTDVDLDCKEAVALAPYFLPMTNSKYGRAGKKKSHYLYTCADPDPTAGIRLKDETKATIIELRLGGGGKGAQSVWPGSVHVSGERYEWDTDGERSAASCSVLKAAVTKIAVGTILMRHWPPYGGQHDAALTVGGFLARAGWDADTIEHFVTAICTVHGAAVEPESHGKTARDSAERHAEGGQVYGLPEMTEIFDKPGVMKQIAKLIRYRSAGSVGEPEAIDDRVVIKLGEIPDMVDEAEDALIEAEREFYQRGNDLVRPIVSEVDTFHGKTDFAVQLSEIDPYYMRDAIGRVSRWVKLDARARKWTTTNPPLDVAITLLKRSGHWEFKKILGIINTPTLRPDGTILSVAGYDEATKLLLVHPPEMPPIPDKPTKDDAIKSLELINGLLVEFPFVNGVSKSVALSGIISTVCRGAFPVLPMHASDAPVAGTGKSYLLSTVSWIATGQAMPVIAMGKSEEEMEKRLGSAVIAGQNLICLDNVTGELGGEALCQLIEQPRPNVRVLGRSQLISVEPRSTTFFSNGNNIIIVGDLCRRVIKCRLDPEMERPELREFKGNPEKAILENRGKWIAACLTICRAYIVAGYPDKLTPLASFGDWSNTVRSALVWLGEADPVDSIETARTEDPEKAALVTMMNEWVAAVGGGEKNSKPLRYVVEQANAVAGYDHTTKVTTYHYPGLRNAVLAVMPANHQPSAEKLGYWMRKMKDRRINDMWFCNKTIDTKTPVEWWVEKNGVWPEDISNQTAASGNQTVDIRSSVADRGSSDEEPW